MKPVGVNKNTIRSTKSQWSFAYNPYVSVPRVTRKRPKSGDPIRTTANLPNGDTRNVVLLPTHNRYDILTENGAEIRLTKEVTKKVRVPPITIFNHSATDVTKALVEAEIKDYSIKHLRHGLHIYCDKTEDFQKARKLFTEKQMQHYSHELPTEKQFKAVLTGLHQMEIKELLDELRLKGLNPTAARIITPRNAGKRNDVLYVVNFEKGTVKLRELNDVRVIFHTRVNWEPYRHRNGLVQCTRCQRPGHGVKYCQMPPRCGYCAGNHESKDCASTKKAITESATKKDSAETMEVKTPAKCCNCNESGHFATDPNCPKRAQYLKSRQKRNRREVNLPKNTFIESQLQYSGQTGPTFAEVLKGPSTADHSSGNLNPNPFNLEEVSALTFEIIDSLHNIQHMPRQDAIKSVFKMALKYLYKNEK